MLFDKVHRLSMHFINALYPSTPIPRRRSDKVGKIEQKNVFEFRVKQLPNALKGTYIYD